MKPKTALEKKYAETSNEIQMLINSIQTKLKKHNKLFEAYPTNYGYLGNLSHIREQLTEVDEFLAKL